MAGADAAAVGGLGLGLMFAGAALYHLLTLDEQADLARKAHETPGLGLLAGLAALAAVAWAIRRRHR
jgi:hypothetical protein